MSLTGKDGAFSPPLKELLESALDYFPLIILLWVFVYLLNAIAWHQIIRDGQKGYVPFGRVYKFTVSGFALNYVTPVSHLLSYCMVRPFPSQHVNQYFGFC